MPALLADRIATAKPGPVESAGAREVLLVKLVVDVLHALVERKRAGRHELDVRIVRLKRLDDGPVAIDAQSPAQLPQERLTFGQVPGHEEAGRIDVLLLGPLGNG